MRSISCVCVWARHGMCVLQCRREALKFYLSLLLGLCELLRPARACTESTREHSVRNKHRLSIQIATGILPSSRCLKCSASLGGGLAAACSPVSGMRGRGIIFMPYWWAAPLLARSKRNTTQGCRPGLRRAERVDTGQSCEPCRSRSCLACRVHVTLRSRGRGNSWSRS